MTGCDFHYSFCKYEQGPLPVEYLDRPPPTKRVFAVILLHTYIVLPVEFFRLLAGKNLYDNRLQSPSREFFTLKGTLDQIRVQLSRKIFPP
jgi:hypothetical protein